MADYDKMIAYYLVMGGDKPIKRFSRLEMSMKEYGIRPDLGVSIMKYGDKLTTRLEELLKEGRKTPEEWDVLKNQVLHSFNVAESIGNRNVNSQEHKIWEERLIRLGILERKKEKPIEQKEEGTFRGNLKLSAEKPAKIDIDKFCKCYYEIKNHTAQIAGVALTADGKPLTTSKSNDCEIC